MPPATLLGYYWRYCRQVWPFLVALMAIGLIVSLIEVPILRFVGALVDISARDHPGAVFDGPRRASFSAWGSSILVGRPLAQLRPRSRSCSRRSRPA